jgi:phosphate-selective porin OprO/OprP
LKELTTEKVGMDASDRICLSYPLQEVVQMIKTNDSAFMKILCSAVLFCWMAVMPPSSTASDRDTPTTMPETVLVRNVTLINQEGQTKDVIVNILIRANRLDVVTKDDIAIDTVKLALDAQQGILLGQLIPGQPPSFLILDGDPRKDFQVLLDTATHARFAIREGVIVRNRLPRAFDVEDKPKRSGWLAYTSPPLALPTSYQDTTKWNRWETPYISGIFLAALMLDHQYWQYQNSASESQVGDLDDFDGGEVRALRVGAVGTLNFPQPWVYTVFVATHAFDKGFDTEEDDDWSIYDLRLDIPTFAGTTFSIGKQKEPISLERLMSLTYLPMLERSAVEDAMLPSRNIGALLSGTGLDQRLTWAGGVFNNWLETGDSLNDNATQYIGRVTWLPWTSQDESNLLHLGLALRYTDAKEGLHYSAEPEFNQSPKFADTGFFNADSGLTYNLEASWRKGPFWLLGEYMLNDIDAPELGSPDFKGYYVTGSWALTGEMRGYNRKSGTFNRLPVAKSVHQGGWGAWEVATRWSDIDLTDRLVDGGEMQILSLGMNWWLSPFLSVNLNYRWITLDRFGVEGKSSGFMSRFLLMLE